MNCGYIQCHFHEKRVIFKQHAFNKTNHKYPSSFDVAQNSVAIGFHDLCQFGKLQKLIETMLEVAI
jgi:hypothetical protein